VASPKEPLYHSGEAVAVGSGWAARRLFAANSRAIGKKNNAADRPSPADHRPQGVMQRLPKVHRRHFSAKKGHQRALALIAVLWIVAALSISALGLLRSARDEIQQATRQRVTVQASAAGQAAIALVLQHIQTRPGEPPVATTYPVEFAGRQMAVDVSPLNGLISLNQAPTPLLAATLQFAGGLPAGDAENWAQAIVNTRQQIGPRGQRVGLDAPEDLLTISGFPYDTYARIRPLVTASLAGSGLVNPRAAPLGILVVLAQGNTALAEQLASARAMSPENAPLNMDTTRLNAAFIDTSSAKSMVLTARVPLPDGMQLRTTQVTTPVALKPGASPWVVLERWQQLQPNRPSPAL
jgi:general secretion pathway protein K